ncbi:MAG: cell division protein FtsZ [Chloroflexi bacterium]|jgi:cell division protein FtsZ|nr:MAG: cell division protein FtsZ [Chloroflexota bacterium]
MSAQEIDGLAKIIVVGVGGGGSNAVSRMFHGAVHGIECYVVNTDAQAIIRSDVPHKIRIGDQLTRGLGVGGDPVRGRSAAEESDEELREALSGADMVFVAAGMGGGTGTGAAPHVAQIAKESGALTIAVVTKPFRFEGAKRAKVAEQGIEELKGNVDTLIVIPNERLLALSGEEVTVQAAFSMADDVLRQGVQAIAELVTVPGEINLDFADIKAVMSDAGPAWMAIGHASGENRAIEAARAAADSPLLDSSIEGAKAVLLNVTGGTDLKLHEVEQAANHIRDLAHPDAEVIFGMVTDPKMEDEVRVTLVATGFPLVSELSDEDQRVEQLLHQALDDDAQLDLPPFLRRAGAYNTTHNVR